jgi:glyoxylase-like metal-dependent hydrolase (beta-lactamase superfamily II)
MAQIHPKVTTISALWGKGARVDLYLIEGERRALVDTGAFDTPATTLVPFLAERGLTLADIDLVLITHGHADHAGGNNAVQASSAAKVFISKNEIPALVRGGTRAKSNLFRPMREVFDSPGFNSRLEENVRNSGRSYRVDRTLSDGDVIDLGGMELRVVDLPGHTPGSVGYYWKKEQIIFAGDSMQGRGSRAGGLPIIWDSDAYGKSAARLLTLPLQQLCLAHKYCTFDLPSQSVRTGAEIPAYLEACIYVNSEMRSAARRAVQAEPSASLWRQGERFLEESPSDFAPPRWQSTYSRWCPPWAFSRSSGAPGKRRHPPTLSANKPTRRHAGDAGLVASVSLDPTVPCRSEDIAA